MHRFEQIIRDSYAAFNAGDLDKASALIGERVEWPNQLDGGMLTSRSDVVRYWKRLGRMQPHEYEVKHCAPGKADVVVTLIRTVRSPDGTVLSKGLVRHRYTFREGAVVRMEIIL
ncbi:MAG: nuclear transport factor 2 family protein [Flavobacteriales bacterium]|nr:nuclear transport factor 2 family protein [Flavobacteriales bacterium]